MSAELVISRRVQPPHGQCSPRPPATKLRARCPEGSPTQAVPASGAPISSCIDLDLGDVDPHRQLEWLRRLFARGRRRQDGATAPRDPRAEAGPATAFSPARTATIAAPRRPRSARASPHRGARHVQCADRRENAPTRPSARLGRRSVCAVVRSTSRRPQSMLATRTTSVISTTGRTISTPVTDTRILGRSCHQNACPNPM